MPSALSLVFAAFLAAPAFCMEPTKATCEGGVLDLSGAWEVPVPKLQAAVEAKFGLSEIVADRGGESVVFRVVHHGRKRIVRVCRQGRPIDRKRFRRSIIHNDTAVVRAAQTRIYPESIGSLIRPLSLGLLEREFPYVIYRDLGNRTLFDLRRSDLTTQNVRRLVRKIAEPLAALHAGGWVHRDLKPDNIVLQGDPANWEITIVDFGLATPIGRKTAGSAQVGTFEYSSPAQLDGQVADPKDDLYSLGIVLRAIAAKMEVNEQWPFIRLSEHLIADRFESARELLNSSLLRED